MKVIDTLRRSNRSLLSAKARTLLTAMAIGVGAFALNSDLLDLRSVSITFMRPPPFSLPFLP